MMYTFICFIAKWIDLYEEKLIKKQQFQLLRHILLVWSNITRKCINNNQQQTNRVKVLQRNRYFKIWVDEMKEQQYLTQIYIKASRHHIKLCHLSSLM